jgi:hypothetical protein
MKIKTNVKAGRIILNHNQTVIRKAGAASQQHNQKVAHGLKVKSDVKAGIWEQQHNQTMARGLKIKTGIKAGPPDTPTVRG